MERMTREAPLQSPFAFSRSFGASIYRLQLGAEWMPDLLWWVEDVLCLFFSVGLSSNSGTSDKAYTVRKEVGNGHSHQELDK